MDISIDCGEANINYHHNSVSFFPPTYKIVIVGNYCVGKTTLLWRYLHREFRSTESRVTVVDIERKKVQSQSKEVELEFWDTAGQEKFRTISPSYYSGANGIMVMYDMTDRESFTDVKQYWMKEIFGLFGDDADQKMSIILIGTKADIVNPDYEYSQETVKRRDVLELKREHNRLLGPFECSAKTGKNVGKAFSKLVDDLVKRDVIGLKKISQCQLTTPKGKPCGIC